MGSRSRRHDGHAIRGAATDSRSPRSSDSHAARASPYSAELRDFLRTSSNHRVKVLSVFGTRPEAIKMAPLIQLLGTTGRVVSRVCVTAQHRGMLDQVLKQFSIRPDHDLDVMKASQSPSLVAARVLAGLELVLEAEDPDWVLVQGDTSSAVAAALAARYAGCRVGHIEAGLRTFDRHQPFPEEINRKTITSLADLHFAPTPVSRTNLLREGVQRRRIFVTGNTGIDALYHTVWSLRCSENGNPWMRFPKDARVILATAHRRENLGGALEDICRALRSIAARFGHRVHIVFPIHPRPDVKRTVRALLDGLPNVQLLEPLGYRDLVRVLLCSDTVITDSGGLQEEAPALGKPVLVLRNVTERPEAVAAGSARLVGTGRDRIVEEAARLLESREAYSRMALPMEHYGDGHAADRVLSVLLAEPFVEWSPAVTSVTSDHPRLPKSKVEHQEAAL